jgi:hypothetical protein
VIQQLIVPKHTRIFRLFAFGIRLEEALNGGPLDINYVVRGTNLCHFVRTIVIGIPFVFAMQLLFIAAPLVALYWLPRYLFGVTGWLHVLEIFGGTALTGGIVALILYLVGVYGANQGSEPDDTGGRKRRGPPVFVEWIKAKKARICPMVEWSEQ